MVRRWHCHKLSLAFLSHARQTQIGMDQPAGFPGAALVPGHMTLGPPQTPWALQPVLRYTLKAVLRGAE